MSFLFLAILAMAFGVFMLHKAAVPFLLFFFVRSMSFLSLVQTDD
jgi:hypothetical protein